MLKESLALTMLLSMTTSLFCYAGSSSSSSGPMEFSSENLDQLTEEKAVFLMVSFCNNAAIPRQLCCVELNQVSISSNVLLNVQLLSLVRLVLRLRVSTFHSLILNDWPFYIPHLFFVASFLFQPFYLQYFPPISNTVAMKMMGVKI